MSRLNELLEKRKALTSTILEEEELINLAKDLPKEELDKIEPKLLTYSGQERLDNISACLDKLAELLSKDK